MPRGNRWLRLRRLVKRGEREKDRKIGDFNTEVTENSQNKDTAEAQRIGEEEKGRKVGDGLKWCRGPATACRTLRGTAVEMTNLKIRTPRPRQKKSNLGHPPSNVGMVNL